jgi:outer membrane biosynthesis protein TonB
MIVRKIIITLTTMAFVLGLAAAAPAQTVKTPHQPKLQNTQAAPEEATTPAAKETPKPENKTPEAVKPGHRNKHQPRAKKGVKKAGKGAKGKKRAGAHMITPQEIK